VAPFLGMGEIEDGVNFRFGRLGTADIVGHDGIIIDGVPGAEHMVVWADDDFEFARNDHDEFFPLVGGQRFFGTGLLIGIDFDEKGLHMSVGFGGAQGMVMERGPLASGLAQDGFVLSVFALARNADIRVHGVVHEGAQALPQGQGDLEQRPDGGGDILFFQSGQEVYGEPRPVGQVRKGQFLSFAIGADALAKLFVAHGYLVANIYGKGRRARERE